MPRALLRFPFPGRASAKWAHVEWARRCGLDWQMAELKANPHRPAVGTVIEAFLDKVRARAWQSNTLYMARQKNIPALPLSDWSIVRIYPHFMRPIGPSSQRSILRRFSVEPLGVDVEHLHWCACVYAVESSRCGTSPRGSPGTPAAQQRGETR
eukprot:407260-Pyramimonas_sp.AAC.1